MYSTPSRGTPFKRSVVPEGPIAHVHSVIETVPTEDWQRRVASLQELVQQIPTGAAYTDTPNVWYNTPATLRHLATPIGELIRDLRSTVVMRTCATLTELFQKCQGEARYLFKDIMPVLLSTQAQTVVVIRNAVHNMILEAIPQVPCKMVMPLWMERVKTDKARTVREACVQYITHALKSWTELGYLTEDIWTQVGTVLVRAVRDPTPSVRMYAKQALEELFVTQTNVWTRVLQDPVVTKDAKLQKWLVSLGEGGGAATEELSVVSRSSYHSAIVPRTRHASSPRHKMEAIHDHGDRDETIPTSIQVGLGPPLRRTVVNTPPRPRHAKTIEQTPEPANTTTATKTTTTMVEEATTDFPEETGPFIKSMQELKAHAAQRRSRNSILIQERLRQSSSLLADTNGNDEDNNEATTTTTATSTTQPPPPSSSHEPPPSRSNSSKVPEHMLIATRLLRAHKAHVDGLMETLRVEMDTLRDFDKLLEVPGRPSEEDVLDYFESVGLCLDQRNQAGIKLQKELDRISRGEPPEES